MIFSGLSKTPFGAGRLPEDWGFLGGKDAMFDLPVDPSLQEIIVRIHKKDGVIASVCHSSAAIFWKRSK
jgi:hypothetical protein